MCLLCGRPLSPSSSLKRHFADRHVSSGLVYVCPAAGCATRSTSKRAFQGHVSAVHKIVGLNVDKCAVRDDRR